MSLRKWITAKRRTEFTSVPGLPDPNKCATPERAQQCFAANNEILYVTNPKSQKRKRGEYGTYSSELRLKIGKYGALHGATKAARHFSKELDKKINESTVRGMVKAYQKELQRQPTEEIEALPPSKRGRPLILGERLDQAVIQHLQAIRDEGGVINSTIVMATARGILKDQNSGLLAEHGGSVNITKTWAKSLLNRIGWVKRKGTKAARKVPANIEEIKEDFLKRVATKVTEHSIPPSMVVNFDETGVNVVPTSNWTLHAQGSKQVPITGIDDKRQITMVLANTPCGKLLPPQLIYQGKTDKVHAVFNFPETWHITHTPNHWSTEQTNMDFINYILVPYFKEQRRVLELPADQPALVILDVFAAHRTENVKALYAEHNILLEFVPANCTGELQPLDVSCNGDLKGYLKQLFSEWYADEVTKQLKEGGSVKINLQLSVMKPLHANWILQAWHMLNEKTHIVKLGWEKTGLSGAVGVEYK